MSSVMRTAWAGGCGGFKTWPAWFMPWRPIAGATCSVRPRLLGGKNSTTIFRVPWALAHTAGRVLPPGGSVTFVADAAGLTGEVGSPAFCAAAAALYSTDDLADVLRPIGIRLNTVVTELTSTPVNGATLGGPARAHDVGEVVYTLCRGVIAITGAQISLETSHPDSPTQVEEASRIENTCHRNRPDRNRPQLGPSARRDR